MRTLQTAELRVAASKKRKLEQLTLERDMKLAELATSKARLKLAETEGRVSMVALETARDELMFRKDTAIQEMVNANDLHEIEQGLAHTRALTKQRRDHELAQQAERTFTVVDVMRKMGIPENEISRCWKAVDAHVEKQMREQGVQPAGLAEVRIQGAATL